MEISVGSAGAHVTAIDAAADAELARGPVVDRATSLATIAHAWEGRRGRALEWAIVWLIVAEIGLARLHG